MFRLFAVSVLAGLGLSACAIPHGSLARPVAPVKQGSHMISIGGVVPFAGIGKATNNDVAYANFAKNTVVVPAAAYDHAIGERHYLGVEVSVLNTLTQANPQLSDDLGIFINPRWEIGLSEHWSVGVDLNLGWFQTEESSGETRGVPFVNPAVAARGYLPTGFGGLVWTQQLSFAGFLLALPGSFAYDLPVPMGDAVLHVFPELRYDPTLVFFNEGSGGVVLFSGGLTFMLEV